MGEELERKIQRQMKESADVVSIELIFNTRTGEFQMKGPLENPPVVFGMLAMAQAQMTSMWVDRSSKESNSVTRLASPHS